MQFDNKRQYKNYKGLKYKERMKTSQITKLDLFTEVKDGKFEVSIPYAKGDTIYYLESGYKTKPSIKVGKIKALTEVTFEIDREWDYVENVGKLSEERTFSEKIDTSVEFLVEKLFPTPEEIKQDNLYLEIDMNKIFKTKEDLIASL